jgi:hypothetical protein
MKTIFFVLLTISFLISSCISIERTVKLNVDGSGNEKYLINIDKEFFDSIYQKYNELSSDPFISQDSIFRKKSFEELYNDTSIFYGIISIIGENFYDVNYNIKSLPDTSKVLEVEYRFEDFRKLDDKFLKMFKEDWDDTFAELSIKFQNQNDTILFEYLLNSVDKSGYIMSDSVRQNAFNYFEKIFDKNFLIFNLNFDKPLIESNATYINGNVLTWKIPMTLFIIDPIDFWAKFNN